MLTFINDCRLCRRWNIVPSAASRQRCKDRGYCDQCAGSDLYRYRCHIARIEESIRNPDGSLGGTLRQLALQYPERRDIYRQLYRKREVQLQAAESFLGVAAL